MLVENFRYVLNEDAELILDLHSKGCSRKSACESMEARMSSSSEQRESSQEKARICSRPISSQSAAVETLHVLEFVIRGDPGSNIQIFSEISPKFQTHNFRLSFEGVVHGQKVDLGSHQQNFCVFLKGKEIQDAIWNRILEIKDLCRDVGNKFQTS